MSLCPSPSATANGQNGTNYTIALGESFVVGVAAGNFVDTFDRLVLTDVATGAQTTLLTAAGSYVLGQGAYDPETQTVVIPDSAASDGAGALHTFSWDGSTLSSVATVAAPSTLGPPITVARLGQQSGSTGCSGANGELPAIETATFVVRSIGAASDYSITTVSLLDAAGGVVVEEWLTNGSTPAGISTALSGDVVFPSREMNGVIGVIDRGNGVITRACFDGSVIGQLRATTEDFFINPYDYVVTTSGDAYLSRFGQNDTPETDVSERGTDLIGFDSTVMTRTGMRFDLTTFNATVTGYDTENAVAAESSVLAQPDGVAFVAEHLIVGLSLIQFTSPRGHTDGAVAVIDPEEGTIESYTLEGLANCGGVEAVPGSSTDFVVTCLGFSDCGYLDTDGVTSTSGIVHLRVGTEGITEVARWDAAL